MNDLVENAGIAALVAGKQIAIFYLPDSAQGLYALDNYCPCAEVNVLARGIVGDMNGELVVALPIYKQHPSLTTGKCLEKDEQVSVWPVCVQSERVLVQMSQA